MSATPLLQRSETGVFHRRCNRGVADTLKHPCFNPSFKTPLLQRCEIGGDFTDESLYANLRPVSAYEGVKTPFGKLDWVIFRENTEDMYTGEERYVDPDTVEGMAINVLLACSDS